MTDPPATDEHAREPPLLVYDIDDGESPSEAVVRAVSAATDTPPLELEPLYDVVDPAYLDGVVSGAGVTASTTFVFVGCEVTVTPVEVVVRETS